MLRIRRHLSWVARLCLALFLFSQFAMAAQACTTLQGTPAAVFKQAVHHHCHDEENSANPNACLMHCLQGDQAPVSHETAPAAQFAAVPAETPAIAQVRPWQQLSPTLLVLAVDSGPPIPILYCRFLN